MTILILEDDRLTSLSLTNQLQSYGYLVIQTHTRNTFIDATNKHTFDIAILDFDIEPNFNGLDAIDHLRNTIGFTEKVILVSGYDMNFLRGKLYEQKNVVILPKPLVVIPSLNQLIES